MNPLNANSILSDPEFLKDIGNNFSRSIKMGSVPLSNSSSSSSTVDKNLNGNIDSNTFNKQSRNNMSSSNSPQIAQNTFSNPMNNILFNDPFDIEHMPLTNPPIYEPDVVTGITRRRVSISNGQIGQLIDFHGLYESDDQTTDYSSSEYNKSATDTNTTPKMNEELLSHGQQQMPNDNTYLPLNIQPQIMQNNHMLNGIMSTPQTQPISNESMNNYQINQRPLPPQHAAVPSQFPHPSQQPHTDSTGDSLMGFIPNFTPHNSSIPSTFQQIPSNGASDQGQPQLAIQQQQHMLSPVTNTMLFKPVVAHQPVSSSSPITKQLIPGTEAWKKARLLERNRRAATKCRQKKKMAQQQMQKEAENIAKENEQLKKKVESLETTIGKLKDLIKDHTTKCSSSKGSMELLDGFFKIE